MMGEQKLDEYGKHFGAERQELVLRMPMGGAADGGEGVQGERAWAMSDSAAGPTKNWNKQDKEQTPG